MIEIIQDIDSQLLLLLNGLRSPWLDLFMREVSGKAVWIPFYISIAIVVIKRYGWKRGLLLVAAIGAAAGCADLVSARLIRPWAARLRPSNLDNPLSALVYIVEGYRGGMYGFPSCHASTTFALALCSTLILRNRYYGAFILLWAILQCYTRLYLGVHYPLDLLAGAFVGSAFGLCAALLSRRLWQPAPFLSTPWALIPIAVGAATLLILAFLPIF